MTNQPIQMEFPFVEKLITLNEAAELLGVPYFKLQRAVRAGQIPTYSLFNGRRLVRMSEVIALIESSRKGGQS